MEHNGEGPPFTTVTCSAPSCPRVGRDPKDCLLGNHRLSRPLTICGTQHCKAPLIEIAEENP